MDSQQIVLQFNDYINRQDTDGLSRLMTDSHRFIDSAGNIEEGKVSCLNAWRGFFEQFPDYKNIFTSVTHNDDRVTVVGYSTCTDERLQGPALWTARVHDGQVVEWRVYDDTPVNRQQLDIRSSSNN